LEVEIEQQPGIREPLAGSTMATKILIIEDDKEIADLLKLYLDREGYESTHCTSGESGIEMIEHQSFDLLILDLNLPQMDGFQTLAQIRRTHNLPIIIVSARNEDGDKLMAFGEGTDDYVTKPFSPGVLVARIRAHVRRSKHNSLAADTLLTYGNITINISERTLRIGGELQKIPPREMDLLLYLANNPGIAVNQEELYEKIWGQHFGDLTTVSIHVQRIRKRIEQDPSDPKILCTRYGQGYYLTQPDVYP
jgi:DNA-binding response OmpR family regulator